MSFKNAKGTNGADINLSKISVSDNKKNSEGLSPIDLAKKSDPNNINISQNKIIKQYFKKIKNSVQSVRDVYGVLMRSRKITLGSHGLCLGFAYTYLLFALSGEEELYFHALTCMQFFYLENSAYNGISSEELLLLLLTIKQAQHDGKLLTKYQRKLIYCGKCLSIFALIFLGFVAINLTIFYLVKYQLSYKTQEINLHILEISALTIALFYCIFILVSYISIKQNRFIIEKKISFDDLEKFEPKAPKYFLIHISRSFCPRQPGHTMVLKIYHNKYTLVDSNHSEGKSEFESIEKMLLDIEKHYKVNRKKISVKACELLDAVKSKPQKNTTRNQCKEGSDDYKISNLLYGFFNTSSNQSLAHEMGNNIVLNNEANFFSY